MDLTESNVSGLTQINAEITVVLYGKEADCMIAILCSLRDIRFNAADLMKHIDRDARNTHYGY